MKSSQAAVFAERRVSAALRRVGLAGLVATLGVLTPVQLDTVILSGWKAAEQRAALGVEGRLTSARDYLPGTVFETGAATAAVTSASADTPTPAAAGDRPDASALARPQPADPAPSNLGFMERVQDWLARANREFQSTVVPRLSIPSESGRSPREITQKIDQLQDLDGDIAASIRRAEDALKTVEAKREEEARKREAARAEAEKAKALADEQRAEAVRQEKEHAKAQEERDAQLAKAEADALARETERMKADVETALREAQDREAKTKEAEASTSRTAEDTTQLADDLRKERERIEAEAARIERERVAAAEKRKADEARAREDERVRAAAKLAEEKARAATLENEKNTDLSVELKSEPLPADEIRSVREDVAPAPARASRVSYRMARGTAVKRWAWRSGRYRAVCRHAGRKIRLPGRYVVRRGDTLWAISRRHYKDGRRYMRIFRANRSILRSPHRVYPCQKLFLPRRT
ncbi:LysM peptidoglycan-binding domain-containing protein [Hyphomicrobium methylovorum]|uniref:LysM peptidoglycan-binding domain-containing protein n=1 Tax=Hyphomicrobium methylovorum TaxID=84 RepID=UPI0015E6C445|nr:LysM peptidoglycan-binding domain-containing protein [Hyphomicrobium methylovorum]